MGPFLGEQREQDKGKKTLVLDLDETLVHSTFQEVTNCQYVIPVVIANNTYNVYVYLRPGAIEFINRMSQLYEVVIYTASMSIVRIPQIRCWTRWTRIMSSPPVSSVTIASSRMAYL